MLEATGLRFLDFGPFDLRVGPGESLGLTGPSGAGKTCLLRSLADLDPHTGHVALDGTVTTDVPAPDWRRMVGYLAAESRWWADTVGPHFPNGGVSADGSYSLSAVDFGPEVLAWPVQRLSTGERQRLALLRLLGNEPRVLLLDEPTSGLDAGNIRRAEDLILQYRDRRRAAVIWVGHDRGQLERVADRILCLEHNRLEPLA